MEYLSFDLRLGEFDPASGSLVAEVLHSPVGESERYRVQIAPDLLASGGRADRTPDSVVMLGKRLLRSVFTRDSLMLWYESCQVARERNRGLRLRLHIDSLELIKLPWELMYDPQKGEFLVFDPTISLVRYLRLHAPPPPLRERGSVKLLVVVAAPEDQPALNWRHELTMLAEALEELIDLGKVQLIPCLHATHEMLHMALLEQSPDVVHFIGHGHYDHAHKRGWLSLENKRSKSAPIEAQDLARMFRRYGGNLVVLNACDTANGDWAGLAPALVRAEVPAVVAMQWPVEDRAAIRFSRLFYRALAMGRTVDECVAEGRIGASATSADPNDWAAPVLFLRSNSGRLWREDVIHARADSAAAAEGTLRGGPPSPERGRDDGFLFPTRGPLLPEEEGRLLIDRPELRRVRRLAQQPSVSQYIALLSARQTGKTTIILNLWRDLAGRYACVFVDLSVLRAQDAQACFQFLAFHLVNALSEHLGSSEPPRAQDVTDGAGLIRFLRELAGKLEVPRVVVMLDEVGALRPTASDAVFNALRAVFTQGRGGDGALARYLFVFSGAVDLYALTAGANSPLNICEKVYLRDFGRPEVERLLREFERLEIAVPDSAVDQVYTLTNGHPYLTMRLCALLERANVTELSARNIEAAAEEMLVDDDNIHHVINQLDQRPAERARLRSIVVDGRELPFTRNDPVLASLEMIGAIQPSQPCRVRNQLYERALQPYLATHGADLPATPPPHGRRPGAEDPEAAFVGVETLRARALDRRGLFHEGARWEAYAAALFSLVPCLTLYPDTRARQRRMGVPFAIAKDARDALWRAHGPALLVQRANLSERPANQALAEAVRQAREMGLRLAVILTAGPGVPSPKHRASLSGVYDGVTVLVLDDIAVAPILETHGDLEGYLLHRMAAAQRNQARLSHA